MSLNCRETRPVVGCYTNAAGVPTSVLIHVIYEEGRAIGQAVTTADAAQTPIDTSTGTLVAGACPVAQPDVEWEKLCDEQANGSIIEFFRRSITRFDAAGAVIAPVEVADFALDKVTPYVVAGTVVTCNEDCDPIGVVGTITAWTAI